MSCPIVIKTIDSLEDKGIYEHDTSRVLNKPAFIAYNDKWSQIAKDKFNLTNVDKMFNVVDGGLKKMLSGSSYLRDNKESITRAFVNQDFFNELQEKYDLANKPADTSVNRIKEVNKEQKIEVKPGVPELFESNPELANAVYEALGFDVDSNITIKKEFNPDIPEATTYVLRINNKYAGLIAVDDNGTINSSIGQTGVELEPEFQGKGYGKKIYLKAAQELAKEGKNLKSELFGKENINESATRVWKSLVRDGYAIDKGDYYEVVNTVTPQQKQQAQQLYSQYLDTIFPDSKVKDIVYHGGTITKDQNFNVNKNGIHFSTSIERVKERVKDETYTRFKNLIAAVVNIKNASTNVFEIHSDSFERDIRKKEKLFSRDGKQVEVDRLQKQYQKEGKDREEARKLAIEQVNKKIKDNYYENQSPYDALIGLEKYIYREDVILKPTQIGEYNIEAAGDINIAVKNPEQIHILGSKQDIEGFKKFMKNTNKQNNTKIELNTDFDVDKLSDDLNLDKDCK